ncbi:hypothetical protein L3X38_007850 [Prunus dulcis]|uniref:Uncharacterized protein n=1 Tax=Prunus dulcis TaxID=3755 RepID=A0AAD4ZVB8_PRUDU|nr:hypothetical protein L3X38_007850 [Prunus dulcis]
MEKSSCLRALEHQKASCLHAQAREVSPNKQEWKKVKEKGKGWLDEIKDCDSDEEEMVWSGVRQLDRALRLFKFVWERAGMKEALQLQGHIWCVGAEGRTLTYRGNTFFVHGIHV